MFTRGLTGPGGIQVVPVSLSTGPGSVGPTVIEGRAPAGPDELGMSPALLGEIDVDLGDAIAMSQRSETGATTRRTFRIVGTVAMPFHSVFLNPVALTLDGVARLHPGEGIQPDGVVVDLADGANWPEVARRVGIPDEGVAERFEQPDVVGLIGLNAERSRRAPVALVAILGIMVLGVLVHMIVTIVGGRRHDLAVLRAIGYSSRQTRLTVAWMATLLSTATLIVALPIGYVAGRAIWLNYAASLFVLPESRVPWRALIALVAGTLVVANLLALLAVRRVARDATVGVFRPE